MMLQNVTELTAIATTMPPGNQDWFFPNLTFNILVGAGKKTGQIVIENCPWAAEYEKIHGDWIEAKMDNALLFSDSFSVILIMDTYRLVNLQLSNWLVNINHLYLPRQNFSFFFAPVKY